MKIFIRLRNVLVTLRGRQSALMTDLHFRQMFKIQLWTSEERVKVLFQCTFLVDRDKRSGAQDDQCAKEYTHS